MITSRKQRLPIERYALLTESAPELGEKLDTWYRFYQPATPGERELIDMTVMASVQLHRVHGCLTETANQQIRTARFDFDCGQEDEVSHYRGMLETDPGRAVVGLKRSALGVRFLIGRWERLLRLIHTEGTLYGNDRNEAIHYQGARASANPEDLFQSEGAYLTWIYCLMCQPEPKNEHFVAMGNERWMPTGLMDRNIQHWLPAAPLCRKLLIALAERELAALRPREEWLRIHYEIPARDGAEGRRQLLLGPDGARLLREMESHQRQYSRAYNTFLRGRGQSAKSGRLPGEPDSEIHGEADDSTPTMAAEPVAGSTSVEQGVEARRQAADALAPGEEDGIGSPNAWGDIAITTVRATRTASGEASGAGRKAGEYEAEGSGI